MPHTTKKCGRFVVAVLSWLLLSVWGHGDSDLDGVTGATDLRYSDPRSMSPREARYAKGADRVELSLGESEQDLRRELEGRLAQTWPTEKLLWVNGEETEGRVLARGKSHIVFEQRYGRSGVMQVSIPLEQILAIKPAPHPPPISQRDVRFYQEYPSFEFRKAPPYTILFDAPYHDVEKGVAALQAQYREIVAVFDPLIENASRREDIQVLFLSRQGDFEAVCALHASNMTSVTAFYSLALDRLVVYNQTESEAVANARSWLNAEERRVRERHANRLDLRPQIDRWKSDMERAIVSFAREQTLRSIRHEGAHQLLFSLGVHVAESPGTAWLYEGLATWCETSPIGSSNPERVAALKEARLAGMWIPLTELMAPRIPGGLSSLGEARVELAYAEAWALMSYLMAAPRRSAFFEYLRFVRDHGNWEEVHTTPPLTLLCRFLHVEPKTMEAEWIRWCESL